MEGREIGGGGDEGRRDTERKERMGGWGWGWRVEAMTGRERQIGRESKETDRQRQRD